MKRKISLGLLWLSLISLIYVSCSQYDQNEVFAPPGQDQHLSWRVDSSSVTQSQIDSIDMYLLRMHKASNDAIIKIAGSSYSDAQLDTLSLAVMEGLFSASELLAVTDSIAHAQAYLYSLFSGESCSGCTYTSAVRVDELRDQALSYRDDPDEWESLADPNKRKWFENPGCNFGFYVCITFCTGASSGIGAAACVYLCACGFCQYKPPGCN